MLYFEKCIEILKKIEVSNFRGEIFPYSKAFDDILAIFEKNKLAKRRIYFCGNGGSAGIAVHMTADFLKNGEFRACSLYNPSVLTCLANDFEFGEVFAKQLELLIDPEDLVIAISSSGESDNIIKAIKLSRKKGAMIITLTGFKSDNSIRKMGDYNIYVPIGHYGIVESLHQIVLQQIVDEFAIRIK